MRSRRSDAGVAADLTDLGLAGEAIDLAVAWTGTAAGQLINSPSDTIVKRLANLFIEIRWREIIDDKLVAIAGHGEIPLQGSHGIMTYRYTRGQSEFRSQTCDMIRKTQNVIFGTD